MVASKHSALTPPLTAPASPERRGGGRGIGEILARGVAAYALAQHRVQSTLESGRCFVEGFASHALDPRERAGVALRVYGARRSYGPAGLMPWEVEWYRAALPPAPASVLIGACGSGREAVALVEAGYRVCAAEPAPSLFQTATARLWGRADVWCSSYEDWVSGATRGSTAGDLFERAPFDAIVLGWKSWSHVLDVGVRDALLAKLCEACPRGPILLSYFSALAPRHSRSASSSSEDAPGAPQIHASRASRWGEVLGRRIGQRRGITPAPTGEQFLPHAGFVRAYQREELVQLARGLGREPRFGTGAHGSSHCTLGVP